MSDCECFTRMNSLYSDMYSYSRQLKSVILFLVFVTFQGVCVCVCTYCVDHWK